MVCQAGVPILVSGGGPPEGAEPNRADPTPRNPLTLQRVLEEEVGEEEAFFYGYSSGGRKKKFHLRKLL